MLLFYKLFHEYFLHFVITYLSGFRNKFLLVPGVPVCGTDGKTYPNRFSLECKQDEEYLISVNLQRRHYGRCFMWEEYGFEITTIILVN